MCVTFVSIGKNCVYRRRSGGKDVFPCVFVVYGFILNKVWKSDSDFASYLFVNDTHARTHTNTHKWRMHVTNTSLLGLYVTSSHIRHWEDEIETKERIKRRKQIKTERQRNGKRTETARLGRIQRENLFLWSDDWEKATTSLRNSVDNKQYSYKTFLYAIKQAAWSEK